MIHVYSVGTADHRTFGRGDFRPMFRITQWLKRAFCLHEWHVIQRPENPGDSIVMQCGQCGKRKLL